MRSADVTYVCGSVEYTCISPTTGRQVRNVAQSYQCEALAAKQLIASLSKIVSVRELSDEECGGWEAAIPFLNRIAQGDTQEEAIENLLLSIKKTLL